MGRLNRSEVRERILELLQNTETHPTASWVYDELRREYPRVALGTVYRNLKILVEEGAVKNVSFDEATERFDANLSRHYHFICEKCGAVRDLDIPFDQSLEKEVSARTGFEIHNHRLDFYGLCGNCRRE